jgi:RNA-directed DNA polymerase
MRVTTQINSERQLKDTLDLLYQKSSEGISFTGLLEIMMNERTIITAIHKIKSNKGAKTPGVDGKDINHYLQLPKKEVIQLVLKHFKEYNPSPVRRHYIKKRNGKDRPLGIPTVIDRIIQECVRIILEPILEAKFYRHSYGYRPYRACKHAIAYVAHAINNAKAYWAIEGDIKGFFDHVDHRLMIRKLWRLGIIDKRVLAIIKKMLKAGVLENKSWQPSKEGTPQGGILSPLLANAYLNDFDRKVAGMYEAPLITNQYSCKDSAQRALRVKGMSTTLISRFADDWVVMLTSERRAHNLLVQLRRYFKHHLKLELSEEKTIITNVLREPIQFLGFCIKAETRRRTPDWPKDKPLPIVAKPYPNPKRVNDQIRDLSEGIKRIGKLKDDRQKAIQIERVNAKLVGYAEYWKSSIASKVLQKIDFHVYHIAKEVLQDLYKNVQNQFVPITKLSNRQNRHLLEPDGTLRKKPRKSKTWAILVGEQWIGFTKAAITPIEYERHPISPVLTPYTQKGRELYKKIRGKSLPLDRPPIYDMDGLVLGTSLNEKLYNFEYLMNREYAYNQTWSKKEKDFVCQTCNNPLQTGIRHCHHKNTNLPLDEINKVSNLIWLCSTCHMMVEHGITISIPTKVQKKIEKLQRLKHGRIITPSIKAKV